MTDQAGPPNGQHAELEQALDALFDAFAQATDSSGPARFVLSVASARFAVRLGGPEHLGHLFANPAWRPLIGHQGAVTEELTVIDQAARATVRILAQDGSQVRFLASLKTDDRPAEGPSESGWVLTGLVRAELADA